MATNAYRQNSVQTVLGNYLAPGISYFVHVLPKGGVVTSTTSGTTINLLAGHGFAVNDKYGLLSGSGTYSGSGVVTQSNATTIVVTNATTVIGGSVLINFGADTGVASPNFDGGRTSIFTTAGSSISAKGVTCSTQGNYEYLIGLDDAPNCWEVVGASSTAWPTAVVQAFDIVGSSTTSTTNTGIAVWDGTGGRTLKGTTATVDGSGNISGVGVTASAALTGATLAVTGAGTVGGTLGVTGQLSALGALAVTGGATLSGAGTGLTVAHDALVSGALSVTGLSLLTGAAIGSSTADWVGQDTISDSGPFGSNVRLGIATENLVLSTSGTTTDTSANLLPVGAFILGVSARVTTTIATATDWKLGDGTTAGRFCVAQSGGQLTSGATVVGGLHLAGGISTDATGPFQTSAAKVRVTTTGTPSAGRIRISVSYLQFTAPTS